MSKESITAYYVSLVEIIKLFDICHILCRFYIYLCMPGISSLWSNCVFVHVSFHTGHILYSCIFYIYSYLLENVHIDVSIYALFISLIILHS